MYLKTPSTQTYDLSTFSRVASRGHHAVCGADTNTFLDDKALLNNC